MKNLRKLWKRTRLPLHRIKRANLDVLMDVSDPSPEVSWKDGTLCEYCVVVLEKIKARISKRDKGSAINEGRDKIAHHPTLTSLISSANSGCHLCSIIFGSAFQSHGLSPLQAEVKARETDSYNPWIEIIKATGTRSGGQQYGGPPEAVLEILSGIAELNTIFVVPVQEPKMLPRLSNAANSPWPCLLKLCSSTEDSEAMQLASSWLRVCKEEHTDCQKSGPLTNLEDGPARLIDVHFKEDEVRVVELSELGGMPEYFALSYCWGKAECIRTTSDTLESMKMGVSLSRLPRTIRDAVLATRRIGGAYLWVDSLCILQDSKEDWAKESAKMGTVYRGATLVIAALHASGNDEGMFATRNPLCARRLVVPGTNFEISNTAGWVLWEFDVQTAPLKTRAWVVQEQLLAVRTLYFGATGLFWECAERQTPESEVHPNAELFYHPGTNLKKGMNDALHDSLENPMTVQKTANFWSEARRLYTNCNLTFESDRPVAIKGIASALAQATGFQLLHGIWLEMCAFDLCWLSDNPRASKEPAIPPGPSWSWLSMQGEVKSILNLEKYLVFWRRSAEVVGWTELSESGTDKNTTVDDPEETEFKRDRLSELQKKVLLAPPGSISLMTDFSTVYLLPDGYLTLKKPEATQPATDDVDNRSPIGNTWSESDVPFEDGKASVSEHQSIEGGKRDTVALISPSGTAIGSAKQEKKPARSAADFEYKWYPDREVDPVLKKASFINLMHFESWDGNREGAAGIIAIEKEGRTFERIGVFKKWVFKDESKCNYQSVEGGNDPRYLPPNPFASRKFLKRFVILI